MHLQQTKVESRKTGGPQYYFHNLTSSVKEFLRRRGACPVVLQTPYGITASEFMAVDRDHKIDNGGAVVAGKVGHDRIQQAGSNSSIGEAIRHWYGLSTGDVERIDVEVVIHPDDHFILTPTSVQMRKGARSKPLPKMPAPLSFHRDHQGKLWKDQIAELRRASGADVRWAAAQIGGLVADHRSSDASHILESDLLRAAGAFSLLGLRLGPYRGKGYDCVRSQFKFCKRPPYNCPVEIKKHSKGFGYQVTQYPRLPRAVVLCMRHDGVNLPDHIDVIELPALAEYLCA